MLVLSLFVFNLGNIAEILSRIIAASIFLSFQICNESSQLLALLMATCKCLSMWAALT